MNSPDNPQTVYTRDDHPFSMDDLIIAGALGLIGLYLAVIIVLLAAFSFAGLMYRSLAAGDTGVVIMGVLGILIILSMYVAIGFWLQKTDRI